MTPVLTALLAGLLVGAAAGIWIGGNWLVWGELGRELRALRRGTLPAHSLRGGRPFMPGRSGIKP